MINWDGVVALIFVGSTIGSYKLMKWYYGRKNKGDEK